MLRLLGICIAATAALGVAGCASSGSKPAAGKSGVSTAMDKTSAGIGDAALTPLNDFNLRRTEIPARLQALYSPYAPVPVVSCAAVGAEIIQLTKILGADSDAPPLPEASLEQKAGSGAADLALGGVASAATDFIPFRSIVREATGASEHERQLRAAYERGVARRAYLKGVGAQIGCAPPAAPEPGAGVPPPGPTIEYRSKVQPKSPG